MTNENWTDGMLSPDDRRFYARERMIELVYVTKQRQGPAIDPVKLRKAIRASKRRRFIQLAVAYSVMALTGVVIVAGIVAVIWGLCMLAWAGFGS